MAAVISNLGGFYSTFAYVSEARRMGLTVRPPDVNRSDVRWKGRGRALRVGWLSVADLGAETRQRIAHRRNGRPYHSLADFLHRVRPEEPEARSLIHAGAFDALHPDQSRAGLLWELAERRRRDRGPRSNSLFEASSTPRPVLPPDDALGRLRREYAALGFLCERHPLTLFNEGLTRRGIVKAADLHRFVGKTVRTAGLLITGKVVSTKHGEPMEFLTFEDETGLIETTFFPQAYRRFCYLLDRHRPYVLTGKVDEDFGAVTLTVAAAEALRR
jgi:DNA polymerase-3 subunit alpha/error-prone DNA polymerase